MSPTETKLFDELTTTLKTLTEAVSLNSKMIGVVSDTSNQAYEVACQSRAERKERDIVVRFLVWSNGALWCALLIALGLWSTR